MQVYAGGMATRLHTLWRLCLGTKNHPQLSSVRIAILPIMKLLSPEVPCRSLYVQVPSFLSSMWVLFGIAPSAQRQEVALQGPQQPLFHHPARSEGRFCWRVRLRAARFEYGIGWPVGGFMLHAGAYQARRHSWPKGFPGIWTIETQHG